MALSHIGPLLTTMDSQTVIPRDQDAPQIVARCLTVEQAARILGIGRTLCYRLVATGALRSIRMGRIRRVPTEAIEQYIAEALAENDVEMAQAGR